MSTTNQNLNPGDLAFYDNYLPAIEADRYTIRLASGINDLDTGNYFDTAATQDFVVRAPQFQLPPGEIHQAFPPPNTSAVYGTNLPYVVLENRVLPWERFLKTEDPDLPWLALLVLRADEVTLPEGRDRPLTRITVDDFLNEVSGVLRPDIARDEVDAAVLNQGIDYLELSKATFQAVVPTVDELAYLAHVREVDVSDQVATGHEEPEWFAVVTGNRLLQAETGGTKYFLHLVSLEGFADALDGTIAADVQTVQLVSLYDWSVNSLPVEGETFKELVENFAAQGNAEEDGLLFRLSVAAPNNPSAAEEAVLDRLADGYLPLNWETPSGEITPAFFRGPFSPVIAPDLPRDPAAPNFPSAASAMIFDEAVGLFDHSYAAAWSLGRALALADGSFGPMMLDLRRRATTLLTQLKDQIDAGGSLSDLTNLEQDGTFRDAFNQLVADDLGVTLNDLFVFPVPDSPVSSGSDGGDSESNVYAETEAFFAQPPVQTYLQSILDQDLLPIAARLARMKLLYGIPFDHLVPDQRLLPVESLRFFYLDRNWTDCLVDGAISLGVQSTKDDLINNVLREVIDDAVQLESLAIRDQVVAQFGGLSSAEAPDPGQLSGMLIRSELISGWPGLIVKAERDGEALAFIRMERLSADVLLVLFLGVPDTVTLAEPKQGVRIGPEDDGGIELRAVSGSLGEVIELNPLGENYTLPTRSDAAGVLEIVAENGGLVSDLTTALQLDSPISPAQFALQLIKSAEEISFSTSFEG
ncbi:MAG: hypothetical protein AAGN35_23795 [Bacteroidota bacterium]